MKNKKLIIVQTVIPEYRLPFFEYLKEILEENLMVLSGKEFYYRSVKHVEQAFEIRHVKNFFFFNRRFLIQPSALKLVFSRSVVVLGLDPGIVSNWLILIFRKILFKKTVLWGHAWPRGGKESKTDKIRHLMRSLSDEIIVYTEQQKKELQLRMPQKGIKSASNALLRSSQIDYTTNKKANSVIYVGRLSRNKKPMLLVEEFHKAMKSIQKDVTLIIVGSGPEKEAIDNYIADHNLSSRIINMGEIFNQKTLQNLYQQSFISVSPGYVGLNLIQSIGYGVPMIISKNEPHSPEIEAAQEGVNSFFFSENSGLKEQIIIACTNRKELIARRVKIAESCRKQYSIEKMVEPFINLVRVE